MKAIKRTVAALLATLMLATSTSFTLAAEEYSKAEEVVVAKVNAAGIMTGTDKGFEPSKSLTRAEAAAIIVRMKGISESATKAAAGETLFTDVAASHWASGYVNQASKLGIVKGVSATEFAPDREVTIAEFTTMAVRALGAGQLVDAEGTWPNNYVNFANENGILDDVNSIHTAVAKRIEAATIVANTLVANMWAKKEVVTNGEITWKEVEGKTILTDVLKITAYDDKEDGAYPSEQCDGSLLSNKEHTFNTHKTVETLDLSNVKAGLVYDFWMNDDKEIIGIWETENNDLVKVEFTEIKKVTRDDSDKVEKVTLVIDGKEKEYKVTGEFAVVVNEANVDVDDEDEFDKTALVSGVAYIDGTKLAAIYGEKFESYIIVDEVKTKSISSKSVKTVEDSADSIEIDEDTFDYFITKEGKAIEVTDLKEDDAVAFYSTSDKYVAEVLTAEAEGKVTAKSTSKKTVTIDGKSYKAATEDLFDEFKVGQEIVAYTNKAGNIAMFKVVENAAGNVAVIKSARQISDKYSETFNNYEVVLYFADGTTSETLTIDYEETYENYADAYEKADDTDKANMLKVCPSETEGKYTVNTITNYASKKAAGVAIVGTLVQGSPVIYDIAGDKLSLVPADVKEAEYEAIDAGDKLTFKKSSAFIGNVEVDKNTKFVKVKADKSYSVKIEDLDFDSLDDSVFAEGSFMSELTYKDGAIDYAGFVVFTENSEIERQTALNLVFVEDFLQGKKERTINVITLDGDKESYTVNDDADVYKKLDSVLNTVIDIKVVDGKLVDIDTLAEKAPAGPQDDTLIVLSANNYVKKYNSTKTIMTLDSEVTFATDDKTAALTLGDDVLVLELTEDGDYEVRSLSDLPAHKSLAEGDKYEKISGIVLYNIDAEGTYKESDTEVAVIIYSKETK